MCVLLRWPPSPQLARTRADTGPPLPNPWRPLPLSYTLRDSKNMDEEEGDSRNDGGGAGGWVGVVCGSQFTPAAGTCVCV